MEKPISAWVLIPARGGSVGIPRKNLRILAGKPLIAYAIRAALQVLPPERVIVITDDHEIAGVAKAEQASVVLETKRTPSEETLDTKILRNLPELRNRGAIENDVVVTVQPTSPLIKPGTIRSAVQMLSDRSIGSVLSVADDRHLRWRFAGAGHAVPIFKNRVNRQDLPGEYRETGGVIAARLGDIAQRGTRVVDPTSVLVLDEDEAIDIDSYSDLYAAAHLLSRKKIAIRVDASVKIGMGHVYRMLALASELSRHDLTIYVSEDAPLSKAFFDRFPYSLKIVRSHDDFCDLVSRQNPDLIVLDLLDTQLREINGLRLATPEAKIVTFEDCGTGARAADLLVTEFVKNDEVPESRKLEGVEYALLSPSFELHTGEPKSIGESVDKVLVLFGGTDPSGLAARAVSALMRAGFKGSVTVIRGLGAAEFVTPIDADALPFSLEVLHDVTNMPEIMSQADFAFTSAGRTVIELMARAVPSICLAQNAKELTHTHATIENGVVAMGLGVNVSDDEIESLTKRMLRDDEFRIQIANNARKASTRRDNRKTVSEILRRVGFDDFPEI